MPSVTGTVRTGHRTVSESPLRSPRGLPCRRRRRHLRRRHLRLRLRLRLRLICRPHPLLIYRPRPGRGCHPRRAMAAQKRTRGLGCPWNRLLQPGPLPGNNLKVAALK